MTTIHSIVEPRKHVRVNGIGEDDVALDIGRPGRPSVSLAAIRVPVADLRAALDKFAPAGSYTRTDEWRDPRDEEIERLRGWIDRAERFEARAEKAERERDEARAAVRVLARESIECHERATAGCGHLNYGGVHHDHLPFETGGSDEPR